MTTSILDIPPSDDPFWSKLETMTQIELEAYGFKAYTKSYGFTRLMLFPEEWVSSGCIPSGFPVTSIYGYDEVAHTIENFDYDIFVNKSGRGIIRCGIVIEIGGG
jgi:hypothetical protein